MMPFVEGAIDLWAAEFAQPSHRPTAFLPESVTTLQEIGEEPCEGLGPVSLLVRVLCYRAV